MMNVSKKVVISLLFVLVAAGSAWPGEKTLTFQWEQVLSDDFAGWKIYMSETEGGPYEILSNISFVSEQQTYQSVQQLFSPDNETHIYYFVLTAYDTDAQESGYSNEVSARIDFEAPAVPITLQVTVTAQ